MRLVHATTLPIYTHSDTIPVMYTVTHTNTMQTFAPFDAVDYLDSDEMIAEYLTAALEEENPAVFLVALADVARARGMNAIAQRAGISREHLSNALAPGAKHEL